MNDSRLIDATSAAIRSCEIPSPNGGMASVVEVAAHFGLSEESTDFLISLVAEKAVYAVLIALANEGVCHG
jgi:hypothetical protein